MHKNELICQKCAINCGIEGNASNENITKYKNLSGVKSISNSVHRLARYRIVALISIGRLCNAFVENANEIENEVVSANRKVYRGLVMPSITFGGIQQVRTQQGGWRG